MEFKVSNPHKFKSFRLSKFAYILLPYMSVYVGLLVFEFISDLSMKGLIRYIV